MKFDMTIQQINFIVESINSVSGEGAILEIGVGGGSTSVFINLAIRDKDPKQSYIAIDTFKGTSNNQYKWEILRT